MPIKYHFFHDATLLTVRRYNIQGLPIKIQLMHKIAVLYRGEFSYTKASYFSHMTRSLSSGMSGVRTVVFTLTQSSELC